MDETQQVRTAGQAISDLRDRMNEFIGKQQVRGGIPSQTEFTVLIVNCIGDIAEAIMDIDRRIERIEDVMSA